MYSSRSLVTRCESSIKTQKVRLYYGKDKNAIQLVVIFCMKVDDLSALDDRFKFPRISEQNEHIQ